MLGASGPTSQKDWYPHPKRSSTGEGAYVRSHIPRNPTNVRLIAPQGYRNFVALMARCRLVLTDWVEFRKRPPTGETGSGNA